MSEVTPENMVETIMMTVEDANVIPVPIDPTLSHQGEAADAKATGDAIAGVIGNLRVNQKAAVNNAITLYAGDIKMSDTEGAQTIVEAVESAMDKGADDIIYDPVNLVSISEALDDIYTQIDTELTEEEIDDIFESVFGGGE